MVLNLYDALANIHSEEVRTIWDHRTMTANFRDRTVSLFELNRSNLLYNNKIPNKINFIFHNIYANSISCSKAVSTFSCYFGAIGIYTGGSGTACVGPRVTYNGSSSTYFSNINLNNCYDNENDCIIYKYGENTSNRTIWYASGMGYNYTAIQIEVINSYVTNCSINIEMSIYAYY